MWSKKAKATWKSCGDRCIHYFHKLVSSQNSSNRISKLLIDGNLVSDKEALEDHIMQFYHQLYFDSSLNRSFPFGLNLRTVDRETSSNLEADFGEVEIKAALENLAGDNTPGPDGFPLRFYKVCWPFLKHDILKNFASFSKSGFWIGDSTPPSSLSFKRNLELCALMIISQ